MWSLPETVLAQTSDMDLCCSGQLSRCSLGPSYFPKRLPLGEQGGRHGLPPFLTVSSSTLSVPEWLEPGRWKAAVGALTLGLWPSTAQVVPLSHTAGEGDSWTLLTTARVDALAGVTRDTEGLVF